MAKKRQKAEEDMSELEMQDEVAEVMLAESKAEARQWLTQPGHEMVREAPGVQQLVERFYDAGAEAVYASDIEQVDQKPLVAVAQVLVVVLPKERDRRAKVIEVAADHNFEGEKKPAKTLKEFGFYDGGQKYLIVNFL